MRRTRPRGRSKNDSITAERKTTTEFFLMKRTNTYLKHEMVLLAEANQKSCGNKMKKCSNTACLPLCDFCRHYNFNAGKTGGYTGHGYCRLHHKRISPEGWCRYFFCFMAKCVQDKKPPKACPSCAAKTICFIYALLCGQLDYVLSPDDQLRCNTFQLKLHKEKPDA